MALRDIYSEDYQESLQLRENLNRFVASAKELCKGGTLYGYPLDTDNDKHVIAALYLMLENYKGFHE